MNPKAALGVTVVGILACVSVAYYLAAQRAEKPAAFDFDSSPLVVEARGDEFQWHFRYPGDDGRLGSKDDVQVARTLRLPENVDVVLHLRSDDYIYIWSTPDLNLKEVAVPDLTFTLRFRTSKSGTFNIVTDPMCGFRSLHDDDLGRVIVQSRSEYGRWLKARGS